MQGYLDASGDYYEGDRADPTDSPVDPRPTPGHKRVGDQWVYAPDPRDVQAEIDAAERAALMPRATREFMLILFSAQAAAQAIDPMTSPAYVRVKSFDDEIKALRALL